MCVYAGTHLPTPEGWKAEWTLAGKSVTQMFNHQPGRASYRGLQGCEAEILLYLCTNPSASSCIQCVPVDAQIHKSTMNKTTFFETVAYLRITVHWCSSMTMDLPKTTCFPSKKSHFAHVIKNCIKIQFKENTVKMVNFPQSVYFNLYKFILGYRWDEFSLSYSQTKILSQFVNIYMYVISTK